MAAHPVVVRRRQRDRRPQGIKVGRRGVVYMFRNSVQVRSPEVVLSAVGRKV